MILYRDLDFLSIVSAVILQSGRLPLLDSFPERLWRTDARCGRAQYGFPYHTQKAPSAYFTAFHAGNILLHPFAINELR